MIAKEKIVAFLKTDFRQTKCIVDEVGNRSSTVRHAIGFDELRPGGTVSGPVLMEVADLALYVAILGELGLVSQAVTTNLSINFLRKPTADKDIIGKCSLMKVGKSLVIGEVTLFSSGDEAPVAHVVATYSIPPVG